MHYVDVVICTQVVWFFVSSAYGMCGILFSSAASMGLQVVYVSSRSGVYYPSVTRCNTL